MEIKVNFDEKSLQEAALRETILRGAVDHLMAQLTPELLRTFLEKTLQDAFASISGWQMANAARPYVEAYAKEYMSTPEAQERVRASTRAAIDIQVGRLSRENVELCRRAEQAEPALASLRDDAQVYLGRAEVAEREVARLQELCERASHRVANDLTDHERANAANDLTDHERADADEGGR